jgi:hypothetical protein
VKKAGYVMDYGQDLKGQGVSVFFSFYLTKSIILNVIMLFSCLNRDIDSDNWCRSKICAIGIPVHIGHQQGFFRLPV